MTKDNAGVPLQSLAERYKVLIRSAGASIEIFPENKLRVTGDLECRERVVERAKLVASRERASLGVTTMEDQTILTLYFSGRLF